MVFGGYVGGGTADRLKLAVGVMLRLAGQVVLNGACCIGGIPCGGTPITYITVMFSTRVCLYRSKIAWKENKMYVCGGSGHDGRLDGTMHRDMRMKRWCWWRYPTAYADGRDNTGGRLHKLPRNGAVELLQLCVGIAVQPSCNTDRDRLLSHPRTSISW